MPPLENPQHERFARLVHQGEPIREAYVKAGYNWNNGNAYRLKDDERIVKRLAELDQEAARVATLDRVYVIQNLMTAVDLGIDVKTGKVDPTAIKALELLGKTDGLKMFTDKSEQRTIKDVADLSEDELVAIARSILARQMPEDDPPKSEKPELKVVNKED